VHVQRRTFRQPKNENETSSARATDPPANEAICCTITLLAQLGKEINVLRPANRDSDLRFTLVRAGLWVAAGGVLQGFAAPQLSEPTGTQTEDSGPGTSQRLCACAHPWPSASVRASVCTHDAAATTESSVLILQKTESGQGGQHQFINTFLSSSKC
jgi:hypothetical protein